MIGKIEKQLNEISIEELHNQLVFQKGMPIIPGYYLCVVYNLNNISVNYIIKYNECTIHAWSCFPTEIVLCWALLPNIKKANCTKEIISVIANYKSDIEEKQFLTKVESFNKIEKLYFKLKEEIENANRK